MGKQAAAVQLVIQLKKIYQQKMLYEPPGTVRISTSGSHPLQHLPSGVRKHERTKNALLDAEIDGPCFLDAGSQWFSEMVPRGVAKRLDMLATSIKASIKDKTLLMSVASLRKQPRSSSPIQSLDSKARNRV